MTTRRSSPTLAHHGVKGMRWGVRKAPSEKYRPVGVSDSGKIQVKKKHILARTKTLSTRQTQKLADALGLKDISYKKASRDPYVQSLVNDRILSELALKASE